MSKLSALIDLMDEERSSRRSKTALKRIRAACKTLGLSESETEVIEGRLDYRDTYGEVFPAYR